MLTHPIETVIFDLDGTLRHNSPSADDVQYDFALKIGIKNEPGKQIKGARWAHYYWAQSPDFYTDMDKFGEMNGEFWINYSYRYLKSLKVPERIASGLAYQLHQRMESGFTPEDKVFPCVPETLQILKNYGYKIGLVSNRSNPCQEQCEELGLLKYFDFAYVAAEVNAWKPDPEIFERALKTTGSPAERTIYVGDNYYADIIGAQSAGIQPVLLDPNTIFPDAECATIRTIRDLVPLLT